MYTIYKALEFLLLLFIRRDESKYKDEIQSALSDMYLPFAMPGIGVQIALL